VADVSGSEKVKQSRKLAAAALLVTAIVGLRIGQNKLDAASRVYAAVEAPRFEVDPLWPKPLPNHWVLGNVIGVGIDAKDHVFIVHRNDTFNATQEIGAAQNPPLSTCCVPAPPVLEFDQRHVPPGRSAGLPRRRR
jgi:hypothetical protein